MDKAPFASINECHSMWVPEKYVVQLYQVQGFLNRAVCRFAGAALANGEGIMLVPTAEHWNAFRPRLEAEGVNVKGPQESAQLSIVEPAVFLRRCMQKALPEGPMFLGRNSYAH